MNTIFKQKSTYVYLAVSIILLVVALIVGIDDNPPGIIVFFLGSIVLVVAFTHNWKKAGSYLLLGVISMAGFAVSVLLHNVFEAIGGEGTILGIVGAMFFLIALFICPACLVVGIVGSIVKALKKIDPVKT
jgi:hypothetical protein